MGGGPGITITLPEFEGFGAACGDGTGVSFVVVDFGVSSVAAAIGVLPEFLPFRNVTAESADTSWI